MSLCMADLVGKVLQAGQLQDCVFGYVVDGNAASEAMMRSLGFRCTGRQPPYSAATLLSSHPMGRLSKRTKANRANLARGHAAVAAATAAAAAAASTATAATEAEGARSAAALQECEAELQRCLQALQRSENEVQAVQVALHRSQAELAAMKQELSACQAERAATKQELAASQSKERDNVTGAYTAAYACSNAALLTLPNVSCQQLGPLRTAVAAAEFPDAPPQPQAGPSTVRRHQLMLTCDIQRTSRTWKSRPGQCERASAAKTAVARAARKEVMESCMVGGNKQLVLNIGTVASLGRLRAASSRHPRGADYNATTLEEAAAFTLAQLWGYINIYKIPPKHRPAQKTLLQNLRRFVKQHIEQRTKAALSSGPGGVA
ncbi:hypothetical protein QJQ45_019576 [Haematococcus lacustris]|nr:hypothetical protein QJQ45_019576 [Haematococcus lacustris]